MSVYIKGMEMPSGCADCPFFIPNKHDRGDDSLCLASGKEAKCGCPLIPVQPHGRLIDADALEPDTEWDERNDGYVSFSWLAVDCAPTIIPADHVADDGKTIANCKTCGRDCQMIGLDVRPCTSYIPADKEAPE